MMIIWIHLSRTLSFKGMGERGERARVKTVGLKKSWWIC